MSENVFNAYEALRVATEMERDGIAFYEALAGAAGRDEVKTLALELAEEERDHIRRFEELIDAEELDNAWSADYVQLLDDYLEKTVRRGVFPSREDTEAVARYVSDVNEALSVAIHMERRTVEYYEKLHEGCTYPTGKKAFAQIVEEEKRHAGRLEEAKKAGGGG